MCPSGGLPVAGSTGVSGLSAQGSRTEEVGMPVQFPCLLLKELWHLHWQRDTSGYSRLQWPCLELWFQGKTLSVRGPRPPPPLPAPVTTEPPPLSASKTSATGPWKWVLPGHEAYVVEAEPTRHFLPGEQFPRWPSMLDRPHGAGRRPCHRIHCGTQGSPREQGNLQPSAHVLSSTVPFHHPSFAPSHNNEKIKY